ncbi:MAG TPA: hypothetical protein PLX89_15300 [Verrucomicrobiota bacterium]|nr:hypothetical protein [Verrucomicrobiales bacterium]HRI14359.1 hypothetical protein [Verrucomicrobiota bacterium]
MESTPFNARRATPEDLPELETLWKDAGLPHEDLGRFVAEFQVATDESGQLAGAIGLLIEGADSLLHSEAMRAGIDADAVRAAMWRRIQIVARNQGVQSIWTQEDANYWRDSGFVAAPADRIASSKATFMDPTAAWLLCFLTNPSRSPNVVEEQLAILKSSQQIEAEAFQRRIKLFRTVSYGLALLVVVLCFVFLAFLAKNNPDFFRKLLGR